MKAPARFAPLALTTLLAGCVVPTVGPLGRVDELKVEAVGQGQAPYDCAYFRPTADEVRSYLRRAVVITPRQRHDEFETGDCFARGTARTAFGSWEWRLHEGGTSVFIATDGEAVMFADPRQASDLGED